VLALPAVSWAQAPPVAPGAAASGKAEGVQEAKPDIYYLKDKDGNLQPVLSFTLEEFERMLAKEAARNLTQPKPTHRIDKIMATGAVAGDHAELSIQFTIFVDEKDWVRVPLRLGDAILRGEATYDGPGDHFLEYDDSTSEYVAWLRGSGDQPHVLKLQLLAPLSTVGNETRLKLSTPRAWTSELLFKAPLTKAIGQVSPGAIIDSTTSKENETEFKVLGLTSDLTLSWRASDGRVVAVPTVLEATGGLVARVDGRSVNTQAQLTVRSFGGEFDVFRVRLPRSATLLSGDTPEYTVKPIEETASDGPQAQVVEVRLRNRTVGPVQVRLSTAQVHNLAGKDQWLELGGFEVLGAVRQWGHVAVQVVGDWHVVWGQRRMVRQVEDLPADLWRDDLLAGFEYFAQPFSLLARVVPRETRVTVEPTYLVNVSSGRLDLEARLKYRVGGARVFSLNVDLGDWQLDDVGPTNLVNADALVATEVKPLSVPLLQPTAGEIEVVVRAHREIPSESKAVEFTLLKPHADAVGSSTLVVLPADNVDLAPREADLTGLARQFIKPPMKLPPRQQSPLVYRGVSDQGQFAADMQVHGRKIAVRVTSHVSIAPVGGQVEQRLAYNIAREPVDALSLNVPTAIVEAGKLEVTLGGKNLTWSPVDDENGTPGPTRVRVPVASQLGPCELVLKYPVSHESPQPGTSAPEHIPLVMPADGELAANELTVTAEKGVRFAPLDGLWQAQQGDAEAQQSHRPLRLISNVARNEIVLGIRLEDKQRADGPIVERSWVQSWFSEHARQDRAVYQFVTPQRTFRLRLPTGVTGVEVVLDGQPIKLEASLAPEQIAVPLGEPSSPPSRHRLEVRYRFPDRSMRLSRGEMAVQIPALEKDAWLRRQYWQVVLPPDEYLVSAPSQLTSENAWEWSELVWGRRPLLEQRQLETWCGAVHDPELPGATNRYLFSATANDAMFELRTARRSWLVFIASGSALLFGLLLIYVPRLQHPAVMLAAIAGLGAAAIAYPEPSLLTARAAAVGIVLVLVAAWLKRNLRANRARGPVVQSGGSSIIERGSSRTQPHYHPQVASSLSATATAPAMAPLPDLESKP
jgi:hypothetical protein